MAQPQNLSVIRARDRLAESYDVGVNALWRPAATITVTADLSRGRAKGDKRFDPYVLIGNYAANDVSYALAHASPQIATSDTMFTDPARIRFGYAGNWGQTVDDRLTEAQLVGRWHHGTSGLTGISLGADYQDRSKGQDNVSSRSDPYDTLTFPVDPALLRPMTLGRDFLRGAVQPPSRQFFGYDPRTLIAWMSRPDQLNRRGQYSASYLPTTGADSTTRCTGNCTLIQSDLQIPGGPLALVFDPGASFSTRERVAAGFVDPTLAHGALSGDVGVRIVHVDTVSHGYGSTVSAITLPPGGTQYVFSYTPAGPQAQDAHYTAVLPSANAALDLTDDLMLRGAIGRALTRADLNDLRYGQYWGREPGRLTLGLGNPALKPQFATHYDLSLEWYLSKVSYLSVAGFRKELTNLFQSHTIAASLPIAPERVFITQTVNQSRGRVDGVEVTAQYTLDARFGWLSGFGECQLHACPAASARSAGRLRLHPHLARCVQCQRLLRQWPARGPRVVQLAFALDDGVRLGRPRRRPDPRRLRPGRRRAALQFQPDVAAVRRHHQPDRRRQPDLWRRGIALHQPQPDLSPRQRRRAAALLTTRPAAGAPRRGAGRGECAHPSHSAVSVPSCPSGASAARSAASSGGSGWVKA
ncbi:TonB-dependent receptor domain-containing protein [Sphingomonas kyungheensis]|uniref:TonB-dependent receptor n=1 Tax=Sphingomonas kyungheensis TaxID=1069987 RepID=A0ABU8H7F5_9SPHN